MIFLPECFDLICSSKESTFDQSESVDGPLINSYRQLAKKHHLWLSLGGFHEKVDHSSRLLNTHLLINERGEIVSRYSKIHLFDVQSGSINYKESDFTGPGEEIVPPVSTPIGRLALGIVRSSLSSSVLPLTMCRFSVTIFVSLNSLVCWVWRAQRFSVIRVHSLKTRVEPIGKFFFELGPLKINVSSSPRLKSVNIQEEEEPLDIRWFDQLRKKRRSKIERNNLGCRSLGKDSFGSEGRTSVDRSDRHWSPIDRRDEKEDDHRRTSKKRSLSIDRNEETSRSTLPRREYPLGTNSHLQSTSLL